MLRRYVGYCHLWIAALGGLAVALHEHHISGFVGAGGDWVTQAEF